MVNGFVQPVGVYLMSGVNNILTTIKDLQWIVDHARSLSSRDRKLEYLKSQDRDVLNFLGANITKDGIAKATANEIPVSKESKSSMEDIIKVFAETSNYSRKKDKIRLMHTIQLSSEDREFVITCLFGSLKFLDSGYFR